MADEQTEATGAGAAPAGPRISIKAQYVRDASFENVAVRKGDGRTDVKPEIQVAVNLDAKKRSETIFEVLLKVTGTARAGEETMFVVEVEYGGLFEVSGVAEAQLHPLLLIECPRLLFPFARRVVADMTRDGGYPPLMLDLVDFAALYRAEVERRRAEQPLAGTPAGNA